MGAAAGWLSIAVVVALATAGGVLIWQGTRQQSRTKRDVMLTIGSVAAMASILTFIMTLPQVRQLRFRRKLADPSGVAPTATMFS